jgi:GST-like protein
MIRLHFHPSPNPMKVALMLEETGTPYEVVPVDTFRGAQHAPAFTALNPNAKVPVIETADGVVFDSNAILLHLAETTGRFLPAPGPDRMATLSWLFFVATGLSPFSGQAVHFLHMCPEDIPYAKNRYLKEVERHYRVMDDRLATALWLGGAEYSIADMAAWGWLDLAGYVVGEAALRPGRTWSGCTPPSPPVRPPRGPTRSRTA